MKPYRSRKLLDAARDQPCVFCGSTETTIPAHLPGSFYRMPAGTGQKTHDWLVAHLCHEHHEQMDSEWRKDGRIRMMALCLTLERLFDDGVLVAAPRSKGLNYNGGNYDSNR